MANIDFNDPKVKERFIATRDFWAWEVVNKSFNKQRCYEDKRLDGVLNACAFCHYFNEHQISAYDHGKSCEKCPLGKELGICDSDSYKSDAYSNWHNFKYVNGGSAAILDFCNKFIKEHWPNEV